MIADIMYLSMIVIAVVALLALLIFVRSRRADAEVQAGYAQSVDSRQAERRGALVAEENYRDHLQRAKDG